MMMTIMMIIKYQVDPGEANVFNCSQPASIISKRNCGPNFWILRFGKCKYIIVISSKAMSILKHLYRDKNNDLSNIKKMPASLD